MIPPGDGQPVDLGARQEDETGAWSIWGIRLTMFLSVAIAVCLGWAWLETFYRHVAVNSQLSYGSFDPPLPSGIPLSVKVRPIIGNHYFGDFQLPWAYAAELRHGFSPYLELYRPEQYPPFAQVLFVPLTLLSLPAAAAIYFLLSVGVLLVPLWLMLAPLKWEYRTIILTPVALVTTPFISLLDRGNDIGIAVGLIAWALWAWRSERWVVCGAFLAAAIALKAYPAALLVVPLALRRYRFTALVAGSAVLVSLATLAAYPGGYVRNLRAFLPALEGRPAPRPSYRAGASIRSSRGQPGCSSAHPPCTTSWRRKGSSSGCHRSSTSAGSTSSFGEDACPSGAGARWHWRRSSSSCP